jgi:cysteine desulfurase
MTRNTVYLDYNATTPVDPRVYQAMDSYFKENYGNASSVAHVYGWTAKAAVDKARKQIADMLKLTPKTILWTSGATESNNMALLGVLRPILKKSLPCHLITTQIEHKAILDVAQALESEGAEVTYLAPNDKGEISLDVLTQAIRPDTRMISIIMGQNEIGTLQDIEAMGRMIIELNKNRPETPIYFHIDAAQTLGKYPIDMKAWGVHLLSGSGHKIYGPKGIGILAMNESHFPIEIESIIYGGSQEGGLRPGTLNVPGIVGFGEACMIAQNEMVEENSRLTELRDLFINRLEHNFDNIKINGTRRNRLSNNINFSISGLSSDVFSLGLSGLAVSSASACTGGASSHVLKAIGLNEEMSRATIRIGIGRFTKPEDLDLAYKKISAMIEKNKKQSAI